MNKPPFLAPLMLALGVSPWLTFPAQAAGDAAAAAPLLGRCVACHGADGIGKAPNYPNLQQQKPAYLEKQLKAFRSGERKDPNMSAMAKGLTDSEIANLAAYFSTVD